MLWMELLKLASNCGKVLNIEDIAECRSDRLIKWDRDYPQNPDKPSPEDSWWEWQTDWLLLGAYETMDRDEYLNNQHDRYIENSDDEDLSYWNVHYRIIKSA